MFFVSFQRSRSDHHGSGCIAKNIFCSDILLLMFTDSYNMWDKIYRFKNPNIHIVLTLLYLSVSNILLPIFSICGFFGENFLSRLQGLFDEWPYAIFPPILGKKCILCCMILHCTLCTCFAIKVLCFVKCFQLGGISGESQYWLGGWGLLWSGYTTLL